MFVCIYTVHTVYACEWLCSSHQGFKPCYLLKVMEEDPSGALFPEMIKASVRHRNVLQVWLVAQHVALCHKPDWCNLARAGRTLPPCSRELPVCHWLDIGCCLPWDWHSVCSGTKHFYQPYFEKSLSSLFSYPRARGRVMVIGFRYLLYWKWFNT